MSRHGDARQIAFAGLDKPQTEDVLTRVAIDLPFKLIVKGNSSSNLTRELFNIVRYPSEKKNLYENEGKIASELPEKILEWEKACKELGASKCKGKRKKINIDKKTKKCLKSLGYVN